MDIANLKVPDLKRELKSLGYPTTGTKSELVARLQVAMNADKPQSDDSVLDDELLDDEDDSMLGDDDELDTDVLDSTVASVTSREVTSTTNILASPTRTPSSLVTSVVGAGVGPGSVISSSAVSTSPTKKVLVTSNQNAGDLLDDDEDEAGSPKKKKINRNPVEPTLPGAPEELVKLPSPAKTSITAPEAFTIIGGRTKKPIESIKQLGQQDRIKLRAEKFGKVGGTTGSAAAAPVGDKLKKRAEKFSGTPNLGSADGKISLTTEESIKLAKRQERFGISTPPAASASSPAGGDKLKKRAEKFNLKPTVAAAAGAGAGGKVTLTSEDSAKLGKRKERFGTVGSGSTMANVVISSKKGNPPAITE